jgi:hypothetical protein
MAGMEPQVPGVAPPPAPPGAPEHHRQARYNFLLGRLRSRQITMEEATELFALMEAMLRASEVARRATALPPPKMGGTPLAPRPAPAAGPSTAPDDMFLFGLLAMGAGAGLLAAMSRRLADVAPPRVDAEKGADAQRRS